jgi:putative peptidoglycan lipid II flippase
MVMLAVAYCMNKELAPHGIVKFLIKAGVSVAVMAAVTYIINKLYPAHGGKIIQLAIDAVKGGIALVVYFVMASVLRMEEATYWIAKIKRMFKKGSSKKSAS